MSWKVNLVDFFLREQQIFDEVLYSKMAVLFFLCKDWYLAVCISIVKMLFCLPVQVFEDLYRQA